jgi:nitrogen-specific signal transduction histidine kinase
MRKYFRLARVGAALWIGAGGMGMVAAEDERLRDRLAPELQAFARDRETAFFAGNYEASIKAASAGLARAEELGRVEDQQLFLRYVAYDHWLMGNLELAIDYAQRLGALGEQTDAPLVRSRAHRLLSEINDTLRDLPRARAHAELAVALAQGAPNSGVMMFAQACLGRCALRAGDFAAARRHFTRVLRHWQKNSPWNAANAQRNLAELAEAEGKLTGALAIYEKTITALTEVGDRRGLARTLYLTANLLRRMGRNDDALARLARARPLAESVGGHQVLAEFNEELSLTLEAKGDFAGSLVAQRQAQRARERCGRRRPRCAPWLSKRARRSPPNNFPSSSSAGKRPSRPRRCGCTRRSCGRAPRSWRAPKCCGGRSRAARPSVLLALGAVILAQRSRLRAERHSLAQTHRALAAAERADVLKSRLLGIASHDLKAPLRAMLLRADQLQPAVAPAGAAALAGLRTDGERMLALVRDLLDVAAVESGELKVHLAPCDLADLAAEVVTSLRLHAEQKRIALHFTSAADAIVLPADRARLAQAITNLVDNAVKFSPPGAGVHVTLAVGDGNVRLAVRDAGPGLSAADFARMFQPFQTLSAVPTAGEPSSGLGLHLTREIVARHGGRIDVDSAPGAGATFAIVLPLTPAAA